MWWILYLFYAVFAITIFRFIFKLLLSIIYNLRKTDRKSRYYPKISIIVPAYNEEKTIRSCLESLLNLNYPNYEVIVVDDGSTDKTFREARKFEDSNVEVIHQENKGKPIALNNGIHNSNGEIIVTVDADTILHKEALKKISSRFANNPRLGAVAGNIKVNRTSGILNALQSTEYITGINLTRKTESMLGCVMIVPGPIAALKREAVESAGFFSSDTFAEDFDITMRILREGYCVEYEDEAIAYTEAPKNLEDLMKQRRRWYRGMLQVLEKHQDVYLRPRYGLLGMMGVPNFWFEAASPVINTMLILILLTITFLIEPPILPLFGLLGYLGVELIVGISAVSLDPDPKIREFLTVPPLLLYNVFLDGVRLMAFVEETMNIVMRWEKLKR